MKKNIVLLTLILTLCAAALNVQPAHAANATVGNGTSGSCTEAAFDTALNTVNTTGGGTITFKCGAAARIITLTDQKIINLVNVTIDGNNLITLNGSVGVRHFFVGNGVTLILQKIKLRNGDPGASGGAIEINESLVILSDVEISNNYASTQGGAIYCYGASAGLAIVNSLIANNSAAASGGAIYNDGCPMNISTSTFLHNTATNSGGAIYNAMPGTLDLAGTLLQDNEALDGPGLYNDAGATANVAGDDFYSNSGGYGGGVENSGTLNINDSLFRENSVTGSGGGLWNLNGVVTITRTTFHQNSAYEGAGINSYGSQLTVDNTNLTDNISSGSGGGLYHGGGTAFLSDLTISGNQAVNGGGIYQSSDDNLTVTNATIANNSASTMGGGLYHYGRYAVLNNVTIGNNTAGTAGQAIYEDSPMTTVNPGVVQMMNSVVFGSADNCGGGVFQSLGHNISKGACPSLNQPSDQNNYAGDLMLGALADNGGTFAMQTIALLAGSPLIDAGDACSATDQRGINRPQGVNCDIGAYEAIFKYSLNIKSTNTYDGWVLESGENSNAGGTLNAGTATFNLGDDVARKQYRGILHFDTAGLPDDAIITKATLKVLKAGGGGNTSTLGGLLVDMKKSFFGTVGLTSSDFQAAAGKPNIFNPFVISGNWYSATLKGTGFTYVNLTGTTQLRLRFTKDDDNDAIADFIKFNSGNAVNAAARPQLIIQYYVP